LFRLFLFFSSSHWVTVIFLQRLLLARAASPSIYRRTLARNTGHPNAEWTTIAAESRDLTWWLRSRERRRKGLKLNKTCAALRVMANVTYVDIADSVSSRHCFKKMLVRLLDMPYEKNMRRWQFVRYYVTENFVVEEKKERNEIERARAP